MIERTVKMKERKTDKLLKKWNFIPKTIIQQNIINREPEPESQRIQISEDEEICEEDSDSDLSDASGDSIEKSWAELNSSYVFQNEN